MRRTLGSLIFVSEFGSAGPWKLKGRKKKCFGVSGEAFLENCVDWNSDCRNGFTVPCLQICSIGRNCSYTAVFLITQAKLFRFSNELPCRTIQFFFIFFSEINFKGSSARITKRRIFNTYCKINVQFLRRVRMQARCNLNHPQICIPEVYVWTAQNLKFVCVLQQLLLYQHCD
jgi:hypothetical protein